MMASSPMRVLPVSSEELTSPLATVSTWFAFWAIGLARLPVTATTVASRDCAALATCWRVPDQPERENTTSTSVELRARASEMSFS